MAISKIKTGSITDSAITTAKISDGTIVNADISPSAAIASSKTVICTSQQDTNAFNISLLGFKMAVNEGLTVFNLVDGVVDEFHDESGTDEAEGSNDTYCASNDYYINSNVGSGTPSPAVSAGFGMTSITEPDTSTAGSNPAQRTTCYGTFTVPTGITSVQVSAWGAGGGGGVTTSGNTGGGGFTTGTLAVTAGQVLHAAVGEGGRGPEYPKLGGGGIGKGGKGATSPAPDAHGGGGGGGSGVVNNSRPNFESEQESALPAPGTTPGIFIIAGGSGAGGNDAGARGGAGGGLTGLRGGPQNVASVCRQGPNQGGGGGDQEQGGEGGNTSHAESDGGFLYAGDSVEPQHERGGGGGGGFFGGGAGGPEGNDGGGGGGSSYYGHPQITSGSTTAGGNAPTSGPYTAGASGGAPSPLYVACTGKGVATGGENQGQDGYVFFIASPVTASTTSTTIVSSAFTSTSVPTTSRIVVFEENVGTPTLNTDIIASISRDGGSNFTTATLSDSGYVTGSSGQRILTGQATISGQPSGQSLRWKLALANNTVKIHGVSLQWA
tara:strand:+ start:311 stop:1966 length:1656 start_codon:yes stop_codon:yes gene_type:complete